METNTTEYDTSRIDRKQNETLNIAEQYSKQLNTNISDYTIDDIFNLLDIELANMDNYETLKDEVNEKIDNYVEMFSKLENETIVNFFENIRLTIIGKKAEKKFNRGRTVIRVIQSRKYGYPGKYNNSKYKKGIK